MSQLAALPTRPRPAPWTIALAFALVYLSWGTTYYAIREGVHTEHLPPGLFGGVRVCLAGLLLLAYLRLRGEPLRLGACALCWVALAGLILFVGGNGLLTVALGMAPSNVAAVLAATTPLWMALMENLLPCGERLSARGWVGLFVGLAGVVFLLLGDRFGEAAGMGSLTGALLVIGSAVSWSFGSLLLRYRGQNRSHLAAAAYEMTFGGAGLATVGLLCGEGGGLTPDRLTVGGALAFLYLLIVGSLVGFVAYHWLLGQVSAARVGTYAYVNPLVAILLGWALGDGRLTGWVLGGICIILIGVALVRGSGRSPGRGGKSWQPAAEGAGEMLGDLESTGEAVRS